MKKALIISCVALLLINLTSCVEMNIMTFNLRYDNVDDGSNSWKHRKESVAKLIRQQNADIIGTQEVLYNQLTDLKQLLPEYTYLGVGRIDGKEKGEYCALMYKTERFEALESGYFWLSETPEEAGSKGWDGACERIATWAILKEKKRETSLFVINSHLDHVGKAARENGVKLLLDKVKTLSKGLPVIITGDFNATPDSDVIKQLLAARVPDELSHTRDIAEEVSGTEWTFHGFGRVPRYKREFIDYIFVSESFEVISHEVLPDKFNDQYVSDHSAVVSKIRL